MDAHDRWLRNERRARRFYTVLLAWCIVWTTYDLIVGAWWQALIQLAVAALQVFFLRQSKQRIARDRERFGKLTYLLEQWKDET